MDTHAREWDDTKARLLLRWPALTADDIDATEGDAEALVGLLEHRLGYAHENAVSDVDLVLGGKLYVPDVADERHHTGSSGPVDGEGRQVA